MAPTLLTPIQQGSAQMINSVNRESSVKAGLDFFSLNVKSRSTDY